VERTALSAITSVQSSIVHSLYFGMNCGLRRAGCAAPSRRARIPEALEVVSGSGFTHERGLATDWR